MQSRGSREHPECDCDQEEEVLAVLRFEPYFFKRY